MHLLSTDNSSFDNSCNDSDQSSEGKCVHTLSGNCECVPFMLIEVEVEDEENEFIDDESNETDNTLCIGDLAVVSHCYVATKTLHFEHCYCCIAQNSFACLHISWQDVSSVVRRG